MHNLDSEWFIERWVDGEWVFEAKMTGREYLAAIRQPSDCALYMQAVERVNARAKQSSTPKGA